MTAAIPVRRRTAIGAGEARRIALAAQGFGAAPAAARRAAILTTVRRMGVLQIDSVNVLVRSHYLPALSRLGPYDRTALDALAYGRRRALYEYWGHEASLLPLETFPLLRWRMVRAERGDGIWSGLAEIGRSQPNLVRAVQTLLRERGPMPASAIEGAGGRGSWWGWSDIKRALEFSFRTGAVTTLARNASFERIYELTERALPAACAMPIPSETDAQRELLRIAVRALGIATEGDLRDYFRLSPGDARPRIGELVEAGDVLPVTVEGWKQPAYLDPRRAIPRRIAASALLSPFDPIVWHRPRAERLFDFTYRIEIYTPSHKRIHGYYVLPYLLDEALVARVDLKADRAAATLRVHAAHYEPNVDRAAVRERLRGDLRALAMWLGLERVALPKRF